MQFLKVSTKRLPTKVFGITSVATALLGLTLLAGCGGGGGGSLGGGGTSSAGLPTAKATMAQVQQGRYLVTGVGCSDCHNRGKDDPTDPNWLAGYMGPPTGGPPGSFTIAPPGLPASETFAANLTPDATTGLGQYTDRQVYNALKYGLDPGATPDGTITSTTPGQGGFPATPHYLPPPMPWPSIRHLSDADLWAIVAYLKHGNKAVTNAVPNDTNVPADFWASYYTTAAAGPAVLPAYPNGNEQFNP